MATTGALRKYLAQNRKEFDPRKYLNASITAMQDICKARYIAFGSAGQASAIKPISCETMIERYKSGELQAVVK